MKLSSVLLVDYDPCTNYHNEQLLQRLGVAERYFAAIDGVDALAALDDLAAAARPTNPVLVLLDAETPCLDSRALAKAYQKLPATQQQSVVIVLHTASPECADLRRVGALPVAGLVGKPLTKEKLDTIFQRYFSAA